MNESDVEFKLNEGKNRIKDIEREEGELSDDNTDLLDNFIFKEAHLSDDYIGDNESEVVDCLKAFDVASNGSLLKALLARKSRRNKKKGKAVAEPEFVLPDDLDEKLGRIKLSDGETLNLCGKMILRIEDTQTITFRASGEDSVMDLGTAIFDDRGGVIGIIGYIFGKADELCYQLICKDLSTCESLAPGDDLFCAPYSKATFFCAEKAGDFENSSEDFSDDEKELKHTLKNKVAKKRPANSSDNKCKTNENLNQMIYVVPSLPRFKHGFQSHGPYTRPQRNIGQPIIPSQVCNINQTFNIQLPPPFNVSQAPSFNWSQAPPFNFPPFNYTQAPPFNFSQAPPFNFAQAPPFFQQRVLPSYMGTDISSSIPHASLYCGKQVPGICPNMTRRSNGAQAPSTNMLSQPLLKAESRHSARLFSAKVAPPYMTQPELHPDRDERSSLPGVPQLSSPTPEPSQIIPLSIPKTETIS